MKTNIDNLTFPSEEIETMDGWGGDLIVGDVTLQEGNLSGVPVIVRRHYIPPSEIVTEMYPESHPHYGDYKSQFDREKHNHKIIHVMSLRELCELLT